MTQRDTNLAIEVEAEAGVMISDLRKAGWTVTASYYDAECFGNWLVDLFRAGVAIRLVKDRSQYFVRGPVDEIKAAGLFRAFNSLQDFRQAITNWATNRQIP
jgi:hypothetical protein